MPGVGGPSRQQHHITDAGRAAMHEWLTSDLDQPPERNAFLARVFFAGAADDVATVPHALTRLAPGMHHIWNIEDPDLFDAIIHAWLDGRVEPRLLNT